MTMDCMRAWRLARTSGISSDMRFESVKSLASSISRRVMAMPLLGPKYRGVSSVSLRRTSPPGRTMSSLLRGNSLSSSVNWARSASSDRTFSCSLMT
jgi:hypothetical protein